MARTNSINFVLKVTKKKKKEKKRVMVFLPISKIICYIKLFMK